METKRKKVSAQDVERWVGRWESSMSSGIYKPWVEVQEVPSRGRSRKVNGVKSNRIHHFLSDLEYNLYLMFEYDKSITQIKEQYPQLPQTDTVDIANELGIMHPRYPQSKTPKVGSTDFLIDKLRNDGTVEQIAISAKYEKDFDPNKKTAKRTLQKLELERLYWAKKGITCKCLTEKSINKNMIYNLKWLIQSAKITSELEFIKSDWISTYKSSIKNLDGNKLASVLKDAATSLNISYQDSVQLYKHCMWHQLLTTDISEKIKLTTPVYFKQYF
ncbi:TnsA endonuclease N-terminal domain-containing protein [Endozoicomonas euniceicola]|uniref:TnsA endonuclease N-terminal domain-containing protein n=1 Tax=Endozoicomonas euniceicola TaxID=1234143 RepID=A0ABY6GQ97_9GAMM|nr:TnsA endonuclease N-terminal domain-containing protein [Endozoicomonas euniceicola]UYM14930.1 TnsA endonuclease N-terminal domain-containing protein [Endozoicomonas euniceicola]